MGPGETIAAVMLGGVAIVVLLVIGQSFKRWVSYKQRKVELQSQAHGAARQAQQDDYVEAIEERVRVLERIATDRGQDLAHQIESLRDRQQQEAL